VVERADDAKAILTLRDVVYDESAGRRVVVM